MVRNNPTTAATTPPISIHMDLSVGVPVKNLETSEPNDSEALMPNIARITPPTRSAIPSALFMIHLSILIG
jgi:hypothetical protein